MVYRLRGGEPWIVEVSEKMNEFRPVTGGAATHRQKSYAVGTGNHELMIRGS
jgi:hypothetical protein